jgi:hypothetical protein
MMRFTILYFVIGVGFLAPIHVIAKPGRGVWRGVLTDKQCFDHAAKKGELSLLNGHERQCIMKCANDGKSLGIIVSGKYFGFDPSGEKLAWNLLTASHRTTNIVVVVTGTSNDKTIAVKTMKLE